MEVIIVVAITGIFFVGIGQISIETYKMRDRLASRLDVQELSADLHLFFSRDNNCGTNLQVVFPANLDGSYTVNRIVVFGQNIDPGPLVSVEHTQLTITDMRIIPFGPAESSVSLMIANQTVKAVEVFGRLEITVTGSNLAGGSMTTSNYIKVYLNESKTAVIQCDGVNNSLFYTARAGRIGITAFGRSCLDVPNPNLYEANAGPTCTDVGRPTLPTGIPDRLCDEAGSQHLALAINPTFLRLPQLDYVWHGIPVRDPSSPLGPQIIPGPEGHCISMPFSNNSPDLPEDIFRLVNRVGLAPYDNVDLSDEGIPQDGIGCNRVNDWYLYSCSYAGWGDGDSDMQTYTDVNGNEYCVTDDWQQPHSPVAGMAAASVALQVTCVKYIQ